MGLGASSFDRQVERRRGWRFATDDQQAWWDSLTDVERTGFLATYATEEPGDAHQAAVAAQILEYADRPARPASTLPEWQVPARTG